MELFQIALFSDSKVLTLLWSGNTNQRYDREYQLALLLYLVCYRYTLIYTFLCMDIVYARKVNHARHSRYLDG